MPTYELSFWSYHTKPPRSAAIFYRLQGNITTRPFSTSPNTLIVSPFHACLSHGAISVGQLAFSDISGSITAVQEPSTTVNAVTNDTNVTGLISAQTLTLGWSGKLGLSRGGTNADLSANG